MTAKLVTKKEEEKPKATTARKLAGMADEIWSLRESRLALQRQIDEIHEKEREIKAALIAEIPLTGATGVSGKLAAVKVIEKMVPQVADWSELYKHIKKTGSFELLQRRVSETAVRERWAEDEKIPGVDCVTINDLSLSKVK